MNGIIIINKPKDYTSFDVVAVMRKLLGEKKIGHTGTLDPMATGVLPILIGRATKLQTFISDANKEYFADFKLGVTTDTLDITGKVLSSAISSVKKDELQNVLSQFRGEISQVPPMFSAVQKNGVRLYDLARKGIEISRDARKVTIHKLELLSFDENLQQGAFMVNCSKGTYVRTLCDDIGKKLGCGAVLTALQRTKTSCFDIKNSITLDEARKFSAEKTLINHILPCDAALESYAKIKISLPQSTRFKNGGSLDLARVFPDFKLTDQQFVRVYSAENKFIGLGCVNLEKNELAVACLVEL